MASKPVYSVTVGNIGQTYLGNSEEIAQKVFTDYVQQSLGNCGRVAGESVTMWQDGEPIAEHSGHCPHI